MNSFETKRGKKGQETLERILQAATYCLAHHGERGATFQKIADRCGVSQPLVVHYLRNGDKIFSTVASQIFVQVREKTEKALAPEMSAEDRIKTYLKISFKLFKESPENSRLYLMLHYLANIRDDIRALNSEIKRIAEKRIAGMLSEGVKDGTFEIVNIPLAAKTIHDALVGFLLSSVSEDRPFSDKASLSQLEKMILSSVRKKDHFPQRSRRARVAGREKNSLKNGFN